MMSRNFKSVGKSVSSGHRWSYAWDNLQKVLRSRTHVKNAKDKCSQPTRSFCSGNVIGLNNSELNSDPRIIAILQSPLPTVTTDNSQSVHRRIIEEIFGPGSFSGNSFHCNDSFITDSFITTTDTGIVFSETCKDSEQYSSKSLLEEDGWLYSETDERNEKTKDNENIASSTTSKPDADKLEQKFEHLKELPIVKQAVDNLDDFPKARPLLLRKSRGSRRSRRRSGMDKALDELASRCLNSPPDRIDEKLLKELKKYGVPHTPYKRRHRFVNRNILQSDIMKRREKDRPVDLEFTPVEDPSIFKSGSEISTSAFVFPSCPINMSGTVEDRDYKYETVPLFTKIVM